jgi:hypothetical protein
MSELIRSMIANAIPGNVKAKDFPQGLLAENVGVDPVDRVANS